MARRYWAAGHERKGKMRAYGYDGLSDISRQISGLSQLAGVERYTVSEGKGRGNQVLQVRNGFGLCFEVNVSRGFDIRRCEYAGIPFSWLSSCGHASPASYDPQGRGWNRGFEGGMLATCGLAHVGRAETVDGEELGLHGRCSYIPAEMTSIEMKTDNEPMIVLRGVVRETMVGGDCLTLYRTIRVPLMDNRILIDDTVVNEGGTDAAHMMLYHINMGFPLISPTTQIGPIGGPKEVVLGEAEVEKYNQVPDISTNRPDVILHSDVRTPDDKMRIAVSNQVETFWNRKSKIWLTIDYQINQCPYLTQWRHFGPGMNVFAFEPGNASTKGLDYHRRQKTLCVLKPFEKRDYHLELSYGAE